MPDIPCDLGGTGAHVYATDLRTQQSRLLLDPEGASQATALLNCRTDGAYHLWINVWGNGTAPRPILLELTRLDLSTTPSPAS